jgi:hypothetical protein
MSKFDSSCKVCPPDHPQPAACVVQIEVQVESVDDDIRILRNGEVIRDKRFPDVGRFHQILTTSKYGFQQGDEITLEVWTGGATYNYGLWKATVTYMTGEQKHELNFLDYVVKSNEPVTPEQEYYEIAKFIL